MIVEGVTGPILLYDESLFQMSKSMVGQPGSEKDAFLAWRVWVGVWIVIIALTVSCFQVRVKFKFGVKLVPSTRFVQNRDICIGIRVNDKVI